MSVKRNIRLLLAFDGTDFAGWQKQKSDKTVQGILEEKLGIMTGEKPCLNGAGRTDAGVHALGMVANFQTQAEIPCQGFVKGLNSMLPAAIRILDASDVEPGFHARRSAKTKTYWYNFTYGPVQMPTERLYAAHVFSGLNLQDMGKGVEQIIGTHDFSSFEAAGSRDPELSGRGAVRTIFKAGISTVREGDWYRFIITGDGFLRHMVRNIAGTMIEIGQGKRAASEVSVILDKQDRSAAGPTAPARGLFLKEVLYKK